jgi:hypothetical protein
MVAMTAREVPLNFRVLYKFPKMNPAQGNYVAGNIGDLMKMLSRAENVTEETVEFLYIHEVLQDGSVLEHVAIENKPIKPTSNVVDLLDAGKKMVEKSKLKMRFVRNETLASRITDGWGWEAYPAPYWEKKSDG